MNIVPIVYMVDDDPAVLKAMERLLSAEGFLVKAYSSSETFLAEHDPDIPGCLILDMLMPKVTGLALQQALLASGCERSIVFVSGHGDISESVQAMKAGAVDFLTKPFDDEDLLAAIRRAIDKDFVAKSVRQLHQSIRERMAKLTPRESQVLWQVVAGRLNKQIAADLGTAEKTIKVHRARAMEKMQAASLAELVRLAMEAGIDSSGPVPAAAPGAAHAPAKAPDFRHQL